MSPLKYILLFLLPVLGNAFSPNFFSVGSPTAFTTIPGSSTGLYAAGGKKKRRRRKAPVATPDTPTAPTTPDVQEIVSKEEVIEEQQQMIEEAIVDEKKEKGTPAPLGSGFKFDKEEALALGKEQT